MHGAGRFTAAADLDDVTPWSDGPAPPGLQRLARLGHALLGRPIQILAVSRTTTAMLATSPSDAWTVPASVARRLATGEGVTTIESGGEVWSGTAAGAWGAGILVCVVTRAAPDGGRTRAALTDLAELAGDVLRLQAAREDAAGLRDLLGSASHDLRNPLSVLRAGLETLTLHADDLPPGQGERIAELAVRQARRMGAMIDGLLSLHGLEEAPQLEQLDLRELARDAVDAGRLSHELVDLRLTGALPERPVMVLGVADSLARLLTNLVTNAAIHGGGRVWVGLEVHGTDAVLCVQDDGPGMPHATGLDTGERADRSGGHGLGLVIAGRIVDVHNGTIEHRDRPGGGTVIEIHLPLAHG